MNFITIASVLFKTVIIYKCWTILDRSVKCAIVEMRFKYESKIFLLKCLPYMYNVFSANVWENEFDVASKYLLLRFSLGYKVL